MYIVLGKVVPAIMARRGRQTTAALEAKHQRQAERLRRHYDDFVKDGMFHEAAEILSVSQHLNPEFESLIAEAKRAATGGGALNLPAHGTLLKHSSPLGQLL